MAGNKEFSEKTYKSKIIPVIKENNGVVTPDDIALKTGFPIIHIKYVLNKLASKYLANIEPTEKGNLIYRFDPTLKEIGRYKKIAKKYSLLLLAFLTFVFKFLIMITLVGYMIFYIIVIIGLFVAVTAKGDSDSDFGGDFILDLLRVMFELIANSFFFFGTAPYEKYRYVKKRPFYIRVFSFVFGDDKKEKPFDHDNNIFKFIKTTKYITIAQAVNLTGLSEEETRKILVDMVIKYNGDIEVNDNAVIVYKFDDMEFANKDDERFSYSWNRLKEIPKLNYNKPSENMWIIAFNIFNLLMSSFFMYIYIEDAGGVSFNAVVDGDVFFLVLYPFVFSGLFFLFPLIRYIRLKFVVPKVELYNSFLKVLKLIFISKHNKNYIETSLVKKEVEEKLFNEFPSLFIHDFIDDKDVISIKPYTIELL